MEDLPEYVIEEYKLRDKINNYGYVYMEVRKVIYGFTNSGIIAHNLLW